MGFFEWALTPTFIDAVNGKMPEGEGPRRSRPKTIQVLNNKFIETYFGKAHWITPGLWFGPLTAWGLYSGFGDPVIGPMKTLALFFAGWLFLSFVEYCLHRWIFHMAPGTTFTGKLRAFLIHGYHHDFPDDEYRLVLPPLFIWPPAAIFVLVYWFVLGPHFSPPVMAGSAVGYVAYDWVHYFTHHARPTSAIGKYLRRYHMVHHYKFEDANYGVSSPLWDIVFGTYRPLKSNDREPTPEMLARSGLTDARRGAPV